ncbi:hypothetical protein ARMGADRAFT_1032410 [Armillaria gallica]|uniref:Uncharacterized protein n=1 Tax=Armillaria gallica TaxID=47427 RepID=A0A2H3D9A6_ARMGA|nr:hypothetical protein ARMGADRAFT_1032410 [Armillaria gallica]
MTNLSAYRSQCLASQEIHLLVVDAQARMLFWGSNTVVLSELIELHRELGASTEEMWGSIGGMSPEYAVLFLNFLPWAKIAEPCYTKSLEIGHSEHEHVWELASRPTGELRSEVLKIIARRPLEKGSVKSGSVKGGSTCSPLCVTVNFGGLDQWDKYKIIQQHCHLFRFCPNVTVPEEVFGYSNWPQKVTCHRPFELIEIGQYPVQTRGVYICINVVLHTLDLDVPVSNLCHPSADSTTANVFLMLWDMVGIFKGYVLRDRVCGTSRQPLVGTLTGSGPLTTEMMMTVLAVATTIHCGYSLVKGWMQGDEAATDVERFLDAGCTHEYKHIQRPSRVQAQVPALSLTNRSLVSIVCGLGLFDH